MNEILSASKNIRINRGASEAVQAWAKRRRVTGTLEVQIKERNLLIKNLSDGEEYMVERDEIGLTVKDNVLCTEFDAVFDYHTIGIAA